MHLFGLYIIETIRASRSNLPHKVQIPCMRERLPAVRICAAKHDDEVNEVVSLGEALNYELNNFLECSRGNKSHRIEIGEND